MPKLLYVLGRMRNEYTMPCVLYMCDYICHALMFLLSPIVDSLLFRGSGPYVNPLTADPADFHIVSKKVMFKSGPKKMLYPVFVVPVVVHQCDLLTPVRLSDKFPERLRLTGWIFEEVFPLFSTFVGTVLNQSEVYAYMTSSSLQFTSRPAKNDSTCPFPAASVLLTPFLLFSFLHAYHSPEVYSAVACIWEAVSSTGTACTQRTLDHFSDQTSPFPWY